MDRVRDLVAAGNVSVVLAQDRDRIAREPAYHYLLREEFAEHGAKIRAMNDRGDESPEGELTDGILDQLAKFERAKTAERSRRGKLQKARQGKVIATNKITYGFRYNEARDGLLIHEDHMAVVRRIVRMVGAEGVTMNGVKKTLQREGVPSPDGGRYWNKKTLKRMLLDDIYLPTPARDRAHGGRRPDVSRSGRTPGPGEELRYLVVQQTPHHIPASSRDR